MHPFVGLRTATFMLHPSHSANEEDRPWGGEASTDGLPKQEA
jgi:hypothetical protein